MLYLFCFIFNKLSTVVAPKGQMISMYFEVKDQSKVQLLSARYLATSSIYSNSTTPRTLVDPKMIILDCRYLFKVHDLKRISQIVGVLKGCLLNTFCCFVRWLDIV